MTPHPSFTLRAATADDRQVLWEWANDPATRRASFNTAPIPWEDHVAWLDRKLRAPGTRYYVAVATGAVPIGAVRFDTTESGADVSVVLAPEYRGKGLAAPVLDAAVRHLFRVLPVHQVRAFVKPENVASLRAFERAGFSPAPTPRADALCLVRVRPPEDPP